MPPKIEQDDDCVDQQAGVVHFVPAVEVAPKGTRTLRVCKEEIRVSRRRYCSCGAASGSSGGLGATKATLAFDSRNLRTFS